MNEKQKAIEKINKLIAKAKNSATPKAEADTCFELANKIASKNGLKIVKNENTPKVHKTKNYSFHLNCFNKKFVTLFFFLLNIHGTYNSKGDISFDASENFNVEAFKNIYKNFVSFYYKELKYQKQNSDNWTRESSKIFEVLFFRSFKLGFFDQISIRNNAYKLGERLRKEVA